MQQSDWLDYFRAVHGREPSVQEMAQAFERGEFEKEVVTGPEEKATASADETIATPPLAQEEMKATALPTPGQEVAPKVTKGPQSSDAPFPSSQMGSNAQSGKTLGSQMKTNLIMIGLGMILPLLGGLMDVFWHLLYGADPLIWIANGFLWVVLAFVLSLLGLLPVLINKTPHKWLLFGISIGVGIFTRGLDYLLGTFGILAPVSGLISFIAWIVLLVISINLNQKQALEQQRQLWQNLAD